MGNLASGDIALLAVTISSLLLQVWQTIKKWEFQSDCCGGKGCNLHNLFENNSQPSTPDPVLPPLDDKKV